MKEIKNYLHLYLGCDLVSVATGDKVAVLEGVVARTAHFRVSGVWYSGDVKNYKPILRPLSDMTEEEEKEVARLCFDVTDDFIITYRGMGYAIDNISELYIHQSVKCIKIETFCEHPMIKDWIPAALLQIDYEDMNQPIIIGRFEDQGKKLKDDLIAEPFELTRYLLSKHFDLFNLIEAGLAIDATKINK